MSKKTFAAEKGNSNQNKHRNESACVESMNSKEYDTCADMPLTIKNINKIAI